MQAINFSPLDFGSVKRREDEARRRWYDSLANGVRAIGNGANQVAQAWNQADEQEKAEEWRQRQWDNQLGQQEFNRKQVDLQNERYDSELRRRLADERADRDATEALRRDFLKQYGYGYNMDKYGLPGQFAISRIRNARNWQDMVGAGQSLAQTMQMQDMIEAQRAAENARRQEELEEQSGANLYSDLATRMSTRGINLNNMNEVWAGTSAEERQTLLDELLYDRQQLMDYMTDPRNARRVTPEMRRQLDELNSAIYGWRTRMRPRAKVRF
jgi:hypothetical protein